MKLIDADRYRKDLLNAYDDVSMEFDVLDSQLTVNAIPIPDGATNRDVIKELWHDETLLSNIEYCYGEEWLNAPYKAESEDKG